MRQPKTSSAAFVLGFLLAAGLGLSACSEVRDEPAGVVRPVPSPEKAACGTCHDLPPVKGHSPRSTDCAECHGAVVDSTNNIIDASLHQDGQVEVQCTTCHGLPPAAATGHPQVADCAECHGAVVDSTNRRFVDASLHQDGQVEVKFLRSSCAACHGLPPGPETGHPQVADCATCHGAVVDAQLNIIAPELHRNGRVEVQVHPDGWTDPTAGANFHGQAIRLAGWRLEGCQACHGTDYAGGSSGTSCLNCHAQTPEGCNVCHGSQDNPAPPKDLQGRRETSALGVGAHQAHLRGSLLARPFTCAECHHLPESFADPAHIDGDGQAELTWGELARTGGLQPQFDPQTATCSGTYCHSGGRFGNGGAVIWTQVGQGQGSCGTCHGLPPGPETGHMEIPQGLTCASCHPSVVGQDLSIIDKELHINGRTDF